MKLYVCWNTVQVPRPPRGHPCHNAYKALRDAGHDPEVMKSVASASGHKAVHRGTQKGPAANR